MDSSADVLYTSDLLDVRLREKVKSIIFSEEQKPDTISMEIDSTIQTAQPSQPLQPAPQIKTETPSPQLPSIQLQQDTTQVDMYGSERDVLSAPQAQPIIETPSIERHAVISSLFT